jgi:intron-binding protein aquarius
LPALQRQEDGHNRLKRVILIGDHHQLPPVVKNMAIQQYSHLDQSLFTRFIRLGTPYIELNAQVHPGPAVPCLPGSTGVSHLHCSSRAS